MKNLRNSVQLIGRLGQDPEVRDLTSGKKMTTFSIATSDFYKNSNGDKVEDTQWHNVVAWGKSAELAEKYLKKGKEVAIDGKLSNRKYEDKEGNTKYFTEVIMSEFLMLGKKDA